MSTLRSTDCEEFINDIDGGAFAKQLGYAVSKVASAAVDTQKVGEITIKLKFSSVHDKFHRTLILSGFCLLKIAKISLNSSFFPKPIKR
ncbi:Uncharacterised protein [Acinetobacter baumannii]|nr:Uncharacterised protein [Acinetobacter baumannii]